ncbi:MAG: Ppx/GppA family phosphatase [Methanomassiliicoccaceae archaeon]|nr:Ppx/GppA family phosphatase [Methanomassiliicoccaceae archaeon]MCL2145697.1 Ppx/GppA family phosphatase [Methanomassiliicoccaceae archaeon]
MAEDSKVISFIDIGTNSIHILVVRFFGNSIGTPIYQDKETVRLGQHLFKQGYIDENTIERVRIVMSNFVQLSKDLGAEKIIAYATCAAREASNRKELLDAVKVEGVDAKIISGLEEARLIRLGVFGPNGPPQKTLEIDIGGGSTEIALCKGSEDLFFDSLSLGSVRLAYGGETDHTKALTFSEYDFLRRQVDMMSYRTCRRVREIGFEKAYGSSGTMIALAEMCAAKRDGDSSYMMYYELVEVMKELYRKDVEERKEVPGMNPVRADIIVSGGAVAEELMYLLGIDRIEISERGMKQGMEMDYLLNNGHSEFNVKESSVLNLANRCQYQRPHAETVRRNALLLFDGMKELGIHSIDGEMRTLLSYASLLHDIGEFISYTKHHIHSYTIIVNSFLPGFDNEELRTMGLLAKFHHKKFPDRGSKHFSGMKESEISDILMCAMMLKIADILDRHRNSSVDTVDISVSAGAITVGLGSESDISMEIWKLKTIKDDFKDVFDLDLEIKRL